MGDPRKLFFDERLKGSCVYCGARPGTKDHCPSKVLLDEPYSANLPVVEACTVCNQSFSRDEQYLACLLECVICGSTEPTTMRRKNIQRILSEVPLLAAEIQATLAVNEAGNKVWHPDMGRVNNVILKLARGHLHYELSIYERDDPALVEIVPLPLMALEDREFFERPEPEQLAVCPELGSRAFLRVGVLPSGTPLVDDWQEVQEGRYRYLVGQGGGNYVQIVISEYLACRIAWD